ncbi:PqqD family protein [Pyrococcus kukulkanii]|uniref:PqqD family protein n=1 Tax=Pyrococcus kukulkanii TaxID=1609559 RepID=UPI00356B54D4
MEELLDAIPRRNEKVQLKKINGKYYLLIPMESPLDFLARLIHGKYRRIELDEIGAEVWMLCDGKKKVREIGEILERKFGERVKPTNERLVTFLLSLYKRKLVSFWREEE